MRPVHERYGLSFLLPDDASSPVSLVDASVAITFHAAGLVVVTGSSREAVFDCAAHVLRESCRGLGPISVSAVLMTPDKGFCGRDSWTITVGAEISFSPTALPPYLPPAPARAPPRLVALGGVRVE